jgi:hypothetical protein
MIVTDISSEFDYPNRIRSESDEMGQIRSPGLHLSAIYRDMASTINPREPLGEQDLAFYGAGGFLWERIWSEAHRDAVLSESIIRPGEFFRDGIAGSPDAIDLDNGLVVELKCRWMSSNKFNQLEKYFYFELLQIKCYLAMVGLTEAEFTVFFVCGDWRPPIPCVRSARLSFTDREIQEAWMQVYRHAKSRGWV